MPSLFPCTLGVSTLMTALPLPVWNQIVRGLHPNTLMALDQDPQWGERLERLERCLCGELLPDTNFECALNHREPRERACCQHCSCECGICTECFLERDRSESPCPCESRCTMELEDGACVACTTIHRCTRCVFDCIVADEACCRKHEKELKCSECAESVCEAHIRVILGDYTVCLNCFNQRTQQCDLCDGHASIVDMRDCQRCDRTVCTYGCTNLMNSTICVACE